MPPGPRVYADHERVIRAGQGVLTVHDLAPLQQAARILLGELDGGRVRFLDALNV